MKHLDLLRFEGGCLRLHTYLPVLIIAFRGINIRIVPEPGSNSKIYEPCATYHTDTPFRVCFNNAWTVILCRS